MIIRGDQQISLAIRVSSMQKIIIKTKDLFRGACAVKGNVQVAGHVKRIDNGAVFYA